MTDYVHLAGTDGAIARSDGLQQVNEKSRLRRVAYALRRAQQHKARYSTAICNNLINQEDYQRAETVLWYCHCRSEVQTLNAIAMQLRSDRRIVVPYCTHDEQGRNCLGLWRLEALDELQIGTWGIFEPPPSRWRESGKQVVVSELEAVVVPGVAFDRNGRRLGNGAGYYDRLLASVRDDAALFGVAFEAQVFPLIPIEAHDVAMDYVVTENRIYPIDNSSL